MLAPYAEPKIEPEIIVGFSAAPSPGMDDAALMGCIAWIAHGFEVVQSVFANWKFTAADSVAVNAMHGALLIGPRHNIGSRAAEWLRALPEFEVELFCDGTLMDRGRGSNVLEGPLSVVRHVTGLLESDPDNPSLAADIDPCAAGEGGRDPGPRNSRASHSRASASGFADGDGT